MQMGVPKVSVIMASYNHGDFVGEAIQSVLDQTFEDFELIIIDDGSTDGTVEQIRKFNDSRIRLIVHEKNQGQFVATNRGLRLATGEYMGILNSDDCFMPDKLAYQVAFLDNNPQVGAVFTNAELIDDNSQLFTDETHPYFNIFDVSNRSRYEWLSFFFYTGCAHCHPSVLIRRQCHEQIGYYDPRFSMLADMDLWIRLCFQNEIYISPKKLTRFRIRANGANTGSTRSENIVVRAWEHPYILNHYLKIDSMEEYRKIFPEAPVPFEPDLIPCLVALEALKLENRYAHWRFAIGALFQLLGNESLAQKLQNTYGFGYAELIQAQREKDIFNIRKLLYPHEHEAACTATPR